MAGIFLLDCTPGFLWWSAPLSLKNFRLEHTSLFLHEWNLPFLTCSISLEFLLEINLLSIIFSFLLFTARFSNGGLMFKKNIQFSSCFEFLENFPILIVRTSDPIPWEYTHWAFIYFTSHIREIGKERVSPLPQHTRTLFLSHWIRLLFLLYTTASSSVLSPIAAPANVRTAKE